MQRGPSEIEQGKAGSPWDGDTKLRKELGCSHLNRGRWRTRKRRRRRRMEEKKKRSVVVVV